MTQLELPPISFARYLELLKRRRWQVVPLSLLGLVIGALTAFFVPRYYVATSTVLYRGVTLDPSSLSNLSPMLAHVRNAEHSVPETVDDALERLDVIGVNTESEERQSIIDDYTERLTVTSFSYDDRGGATFHNVLLEFRDRDREHAERFLNRLRIEWIESLLTDFREHAREELDAAKRRLSDLEAARHVADQELRIHLAENPTLNIAVDERDARRQAEDRVQILTAAIEDAREEIAQARDGIARISRELEDGTVPRKILETPKLTPAEKQDPRVAQLIVRRTYHERAVSNLREGSALYANHKAELARLDRELMEILGVTLGEGEQARREVDNPEYTARLKQRAELERAVAGKEKSLARLESELARAEKRQEELTAAWLDLNAMRQVVEDRDTEVQLQRAVVADLQRRFEAGVSGDAFQQVPATVPPAPTEPSFGVLAAIGALVGLAVAIGLVLLIDFLRSTFKTVEDVKFALPVPVLGTMAYLETAEERRIVARHRRRVSLAAASFVVLSLSLVTVYYVAPMRLHPVVLQALDLLLGASR